MSEKERQFKFEPTPEAMKARIKSLEARCAKQGDDIEMAEVGLGMLLAAVRADDPKPQIELRVRDLITELRKARATDNGGQAT